MKSIKGKTIEKAVRYSAKPYPEIIDNALKKGWHISRASIETDDFKERYMDIELANDNANEWWNTGYRINEPESSLFNIYTGF